jgi:hypothetical protein
LSADERFLEIGIDLGGNPIGFSTDKVIKCIQACPEMNL